MHLNLPLSSQHLSIGPSNLSAILDAPEDCQGLCVFISERGWSRHAALDNELTQILRALNCAVLIVDYIDEASAVDAAERRRELPDRLDEVLTWIEAVPLFAPVPLYLAQIGDVSSDCAEALKAHTNRIRGVIRFLSPATHDGAGPARSLTLIVPELGHGRRERSLEQAIKDEFQRRIDTWLRANQVSHAPKLVETTDWHGGRRPLRLRWKENSHEGA